MMEGIRVYIPDDRLVWVPATVLRVEDDGQRFHVRVEKLPLCTDDEDDDQSDEFMPVERTSYRQLRIEDNDLSDSNERIIDLRHDGMPEALPLQNGAHDNHQKVKELSEHDGAEDMCALSHLHEPAIVYNMRTRFFGKTPYTYTGKIVVAVNPYQWIKPLYSDELRTLYTTQPRETLPPHVYATSAEAFHNMKHHKLPQSILVSGESGAGKTETVKILMEHLASISTANAQELKRKTGTSGLSPLLTGQNHHGYDTIVQKVLKSNPLLEAFGNAKTIRNDNSSRFGKFTQLQFNADYCLIGAECRHYLLEKSRVVAQSRGERNYHIFYQLVSAQDAQYHFTAQSSPKDFRYLQDEPLELDGQSDAERFRVTCDALTTIGVSDQEQQELFSALCGILRLGQLDFVASDKEKDDASRPMASITIPSNASAVEIAKIQQQQREIQACADLLGVQVEDLAHHLCSRTVKARQEVYCVPLSTLQAGNNRDALAKELYARLFAYLVRRVNNSTSGGAILASLKPRTKSYLHIDLLDIFGFESFQRNSFEQFCINFANEKLQQKFTLDVFKTVQQEYRNEQVAWEFIKYQDNRDMLDLLENSMGLMALLNEECVRPMGSDASFASKIVTLHEAHPRLEKTRMSQMHFVLHHYAGSVTYDASGFVEKNKDSLQTDLLELLATSTNPLIAGLFGGGTSSPLFANDVDLAAVHAAATLDDTASRGTITGRKTATFMQETVSYKFKAQLTLLMSDISATEVHYVRCIKPNAKKSPHLFQIRSVVNQLRCAGVVEAIRITRAAFPNKMTHEKFLRRFVIMKPVNKTSASPFIASAACEQLIEQLLSTGFTRTETDAAMPNFVIGKTLVFFGKGVLEFLEQKRTTFVHDCALKIQRSARRWLARQRMQRLRLMITRMQAMQRQRMARQRFLMKRVQCIRIQSLWRGVRSRKRAYLLMKDHMATKIQAWYRSIHVHRRYATFHRAVVQLQAQFKRKRQQLKYRQLREEKKEQAIMENEVSLLKQRLEEEKHARLVIEAKNTSLQQELDEVRYSSVQAIDALPVRPARQRDNALSSLSSSSSSFIDDAKLLDDSERMIDYLRKEVKKGRELIAALTQENDNLKAESKRIKDAYAAASNSFTALNEHNKQQSKANLRLMSTHAALIKSQEEKMKKYQKQIADLKEDLKMQRNVYSAELLARVQQQDVLTEILQMAEAHGVDADVLEKMRSITDSKPPVAMNPPIPQDRSMNTGRTSRSDTISSTGPVPVSVANLPPAGAMRQNSGGGYGHDRRPTVDTISLHHRNDSVLPNQSNGSSDLESSHSYQGSDRASWVPRRSSVYYEEESRHRKSRIGGMFKKMFNKKENNEY